MLPHHLSFSGSSTVRIKHLDVPDAVRAGTEVALNCDYDLQVNIMMREENISNFDYLSSKNYNFQLSVLLPKNETE